MVSLFSVRKAKYNLLEVKIARKIRKILNFDLQHGKSTAFSFFYFLSFSLSPPLSLPISLLFTFFSQRIVVLYFILCLCLFFLFFFFASFLFYWIFRHSFDLCHSICFVVFLLFFFFRFACAIVLYSGRCSRWFDQFFFSIPVILTVSC